jgi:hypothetical protein
MLLMLFFRVIPLSGQVLVSDFPDNLNNDVSQIVIQAGAFKTESNAIALQSRLSALLTHNVLMIPEDGYFKVRITGFNTPQELEKAISSFGFLGLGKIWIKYPKTKETDITASGSPAVPPSVTANPDTLQFTGNTGIVDTTNIVLMVGIFHDKSDAILARNKIVSNLKLPVTIIQEWEYYKVLVTGFKSVKETAPFYPQLAKLGYPEILLIRNF